MTSEEITHRRSKLTFHASMSFWAKKGDRVSKQFFKTHGPRAAGEQIQCLCAQEGSLCTTSEEVMEIVTDYYKELFQQEHPHLRAMRFREHVWSHISTVVSPRMRESLMSPSQFRSFWIATAESFSSGSTPVPVW